MIEMENKKVTKRMNEMELGRKTKYMFIITLKILSLRNIYL